MGNNNKIIIIVVAVITVICLCCLCIAGGLFLLGAAADESDSSTNERTENRESSDTDNNDDVQEEDDFDFDDDFGLDEDFDFDDDFGSDSSDNPGPLSLTTCSNQGSKFQKPANWFKYEEYNTGYDGEACYITKERISGPNDQFQTGLTAVKLENVTLTYGDETATDFANRFINTVDDDPIVTNAGTVESNSNSGINGYYRFMNLESGSLSTRQYNGVFANDSEDAVYIIIFEAPRDEFNSVWEDVGQDIIAQLGLSF